MQTLLPLGEVVHREIRSTNVTDQVRALAVRLRNARALRGRLTALFEKADSVKASLAIGQQLAQVTLERERIQTTMKSFQSRIAFAKVTVNFREKQLSEEVVLHARWRLPFPWLQELGLTRLLELSEGA